MNKNKIDPICGMEGHLKKHKHLFCSEHCIKVYEEKKKIKSRQKTNYPLILFNLTLAVIGLYLLKRYGYMTHFMGGSFVVLATLKILDLKGFVQAFGMYDILAKKSRIYGFTYPFIELALGLGYLFNYQLKLMAWITLLIMGIGIIGVTQNLMSKNPIRCACLGTLIKVPLTKFTFFEDLFMILMALIILLQI